MTGRRFENLLRRTKLGGLLARHPMTCLDVGSRGGFEPDLLPIAFAVDAVGFEPDPAAFAELASASRGPWHSLRYLPVALADRDGRRELHIPEDNSAASLLEHDARIGTRFNKPQFFNGRRTISVETRNLDVVLDEAAVAAPAFLKLDVEGIELEILQSAPRTVASVLAVKTEASFVPFRRGQPLATDIDRFLRGAGFELMDLVRPHHWRRNGYVVHPQSARQAIPYSRGQIVQGDLLYFRHPDVVAGSQRRLQAAGLAMAYGFFDHAESLLSTPDVKAWLFDAIPGDVAGLVGEASRIYGRAVWRGEFSSHLRRNWTYLRSFRNLQRA